MSDRGKVTIRMPISLRDHLIEAARRDAVSLNQFICATLAVAVRWNAEEHRDRGDQGDGVAWKLWDDVFR